jgi:hypothetical protein
MLCAIITLLLTRSNHVINHKLKSLETETISSRFNEIYILEDMGLFVFNINEIVTKQ